MVAIVSNQTGNWSSTSTWVGGVVPVNGDTVTIAAPHTVTFDANQSGFASGIGLTISPSAILTASLTATTYLKLNAQPVIDGTMRWGTSANPITGIATIALNYSGMGLVPTSVGTLSMYGNPVFNMLSLGGGLYSSLTKIFSVSGSNQLILNDNIGLRAGGGDMIFVQSNQVGDNSGSVYTTTAYNAGTKTVTISGTFTKTAVVGGYVGILTRNVSVLLLITGVSTLIDVANQSTVDIGWVEIVGQNRTGIGVASLKSGQVLRYVTFRNLSVAMTSPGNGTTYGVMTDNCVDGITNPANGTWNDGPHIFDSLRGLSNVYGGIFQGMKVVNCLTGILQLVGGDFTDLSIHQCTNGMIGLHSGYFVSPIFSLNTTDIDLVNQAYGAIMLSPTASSTTAIANYLNNVNPHCKLRMQNRNVVPDNHITFTPGGTITRDTTVIRSAPASMKFALASANFPVFVDFQFAFRSDRERTITCYVRKSATNTYRPRLQIIDPDDDPLIVLNANPPSVPLAEVVSTDDTDVFIPLTIVYTHPADKVLIIRMLAKDPSAIVWFDDLQIS